MGRRPAWCMSRRPREANLAAGPVSPDPADKQAETSLLWIKKGGEMEFLGSEHRASPRLFLRSPSPLL
jgi:hypothetical protein